MGRDITLLHPELQEIVERFQTECKKQGLNVKITETFRTLDEQNALYAKGRTTSGKVVTNAKGDDYQSPHQWGVAFDICENVKGKEYANTSFFKKCGEVGKKLGLTWGGDFKTFVDMPHFEMSLYMPNKSTSTLRARYGIPQSFINGWKGAHGHKATKTNDVQQQYPTLKQGSKGEDVKQLQQLLNNVSGSKLSTDGIFGAKTATAVKSFQKQSALVVDGIAGNKTLRKLVQTK